MKLDLIRHARSAANEKDIFSGSAETPLSEEGVAEAREFAKVMKDKQYERHFSSPLSRALGTSKILFPDSEIHIDSRLTERGLGQWEGKSKKEMRLLHPQAFLLSAKLQPLFTPPDGEDIPMVAARFMDFLRTNAHDHVINMVVVTHNGVIKVLRALTEDLPIEEIFFESEKNLQIRSCSIDHAILASMEEKRLALMQIIRG